MDIKSKKKILIGDKVRFIGENTRVANKKGVVIDEGGKQWYQVKFESGGAMWTLANELELLPSQKPIEKFTKKNKMFKSRNKNKFDLRDIEIKSEEKITSISLKNSEGKIVFSSTHKNCEDCMRDLFEWLEK